MDSAQSSRIIKSVNYSFYSALAVVILVAVLYFASLYTQNLIVHTNEVRSQILNTSETLLSAESLQRGYILTKEQDYRISYKVAIKKLDTKIKELEEKTKDNPSQQQLIKEYKTLLGERLLIMNNNIENYIVGSAEENRNYKKDDGVKNLVVNIDRVRDAMLLEENRLLEKRTNTYDTVYFISLFVLCLGLALMIYSLYMLRQRLLPLFKRLEDQNDELAVAVVARDDEIKLKEEQMTLNDDLIDQLEEKNVQLNQFAYIASHDLQEPLRTVENFIDLFQEDYGDKLDEDAEQYFGFIKGATTRMKTLITGLLNYSRLGRSGVKSKVNLSKIVEDIKADFIIKIDEKDARITYDNLPIVTGYPVELRQLFANLISNGLKFMPPEKQPKIHISVEETSRHFMFKVRDNGLGIKKAHVSKIFNMFTRLHSAKEYKGTGIGLAFCQKIVDLHKGKIYVDSTLGEGSTFTFTLKK